MVFLIEFFDGLGSQLCHRLPERSPGWGAVVPVLCWRCTSIYVGFFIASTLALAVPAGLVRHRLRLLVGGSLVAVCVLDATLIGATTTSRVLTGLGCGVGLAVLAGTLVPQRRIRRELARTSVILFLLLTVSISGVRAGPILSLAAWVGLLLLAAQALLPVVLFAMRRDEMTRVLK